MREGGEPRHAWLHYVSFAILLQRRVDFRPQILVAGFRFSNRLQPLFELNVPLWSDVKR